VRRFACLPVIVCIAPGRRVYVSENKLITIYDNLIMICNKTHRRCIWTNTTGRVRVRAHPHTSKWTRVKHSTLIVVKQWFYAHIVIIFLLLFKRRETATTVIILILKLLLPTDWTTIIILSCWYPANFLQLPVGHRLRRVQSDDESHRPTRTSADDLSVQRWPPPDTLPWTRWSNRYSRQPPPRPQRLPWTPPRAPDAVVSCRSWPVITAIVTKPLPQPRLRLSSSPPRTCTDRRPSITFL